MNIRSLVTLSACALLAALHGAHAAPSEPAAKATSPATEPASKDDDAKGKLVLEKGVEAETILKGYGKPYEIKPIETADKHTKVERWIYRRKVKETTTQTPVGYTSITPPNASIDGNGTANGAYIPTMSVADYKLRRLTVYQVTELLLINGRMEAAKQWLGQEEKFE